MEAEAGRENMRSHNKRMRKKNVEAGRAWGRTFGVVVHVAEAGAARDGVVALGLHVADGLALDALPPLDVALLDAHVGVAPAEGAGHCVSVGSSHEGEENVL